MAKISVLITSILSIVVAITFETIPIPFEFRIGHFIAMIVTWIAVVYAVYMDTRMRGKPTLHTTSALFLGGVGGLIYYFTIFKESDDNLNPNPPSTMTETGRKSLLIFSSVLAVIFGLVLVMARPTTIDRIMNPFTVTFGIMFLLSILAIIYAVKNK